MNEEEKKAESKKIMNGAAHLNQGSPDTMMVIEKAIELNPENAEAWRELSVAYLKRGMPLDWKPLFDKAVMLDPKEWQGHRGYLYLYFYRNYKKAIKDFDATDILTPNFDDAPQGQSVNYMRGIAYLGLKEYTKSKNYFNTYIDNQIKTSGEDYADITAFLYRGIIAYLQKDYKSAKKDFQKVLKYSENHYSDAHYYLSKCYYEEKEIPKALEHIKSAIEDFNSGYYHTRNYVEVLYQVYIQDLEEQKNLVENHSFY
ncbi:tetratricopeptide repeat protein [Aquimarina sediminis]|uniref:tetratricopeptide repeat protein n=1 Tax=Aquimarina sediminis TaxID=2070536 RepID=UPI0013E8C581|nr:tetratricopeptide repeat protein [Aquimarina sediminis]